MHARFFFWEMCVLVFLPNTRARSAPPSQIPGLCTCAGPGYKKNMGVRPTKRTQTKSLQRCTRPCLIAWSYPHLQHFDGIIWGSWAHHHRSYPCVVVCLAIVYWTCEPDLNRARDLVLLCKACLLPTWSSTLHTVHMCTLDLQFKLV